MEGEREVMGLVVIEHLHSDLAEEKNGENEAENLKKGTIRSDGDILGFTFFSREIVSNDAPNHPFDLQGSTPFRSR